ncbi:MAG: DUF2203 domain-containing protein [Acidobacteriota bacterium]|nr:DUF2203 domain-containing protein [Acidobacteriota bacterium]
MKLFSVEEANALLPTVRLILLRIQRAVRRLASYQQEAQQAAEGAELGGGGMARGTQYVSLLIDLYSSASELETLGVQLKDQDRGLIDFPSMRDGRVVLLCWQLGEGDRIEWWHDVEAGFAGRQPLEP